MGVQGLRRASRCCLATPVLAALALQLQGCTKVPLLPPDGFFKAPCKWPECSKSCEPCLSRQVGRCTAKLLGMDLRYMCETNKTQCVIGRCVCKKHYCAGALTVEGTNQGDPSRLRSCDPQVCRQGALAPQYEPSFWVSLLASLAPSRAFRDVYQLESKWKSFAIFSSFISVLLLFVGLCVSAATWVCFCTGHGPCRNLCGCRVTVFCCGHRRTTCDFLEHESEDEEDFGKDSDGSPEGDAMVPKARLRRPAFYPTLSSFLGILTLCAVCITIRQYRFLKTKAAVTQAIKLAHIDAERLALSGLVVNQTVASVAGVLRGIQAECTLTDPVIVAATKDVDMLLAKTAVSVDKYVTLAQSVPAKLLQLQGLIHKLTPYVVWVPVIPQLILGSLSLLIVIPAMATAMIRGHHAARCMDLTLMPLGGLSMLALIVVTVIAAGELALGIAGSVVCMDIDHTVLDYARLAPEKLRLEVAQAARFYVKGDVLNPFEEYIDEASMYIEAIVDLYNQFWFAVDLIGLSCLPILHADVPGVAGNAKTLLAVGRQLVAASNVWPYYDNLVHKTFCDGMMSSIAFLTIFQVWVGLVLFPLASFRAHQFLLRREKWQRALHDGSPRTTKRWGVMESGRAAAPAPSSTAGCCDCDTDSGTDRESDLD